MIIKTVDFDKIGALHKHYGNEWGEYDPNKDEIKISNKLGEKAVPARNEIILHEKCHRKIEISGVSKYFDDDQEETFCDLWVIVQWKKKKLSGLELKIRQMICTKGEWRDIKSRPSIVRNMLRFCGVKPTPALVNALL